MADEDLNDGSILDDTKKVLGLPKDHIAFDTDVIMHINATNTTLDDMGVGPDGGLTIIGSENKWSEYDVPNNVLNMVKTYIYLKVKIVFDPPQMGFLKDSLENQIKEQEWRLNDRREALIPRATQESEVDPEWCL